MSGLEDGIGALAEALLSYVWEDLRHEAESRGERIIARRRNARIDDFDVDLPLETDRSVYMVEIKTKPRRRDVDTAAEKAEAASRRFGKPAVADMDRRRRGEICR